MDMESTVCVVGMSYVGLPLAVEFDCERFDVIGYDIDPDVRSSCRHTDIGALLNVLQSVEGAGNSPRSRFRTARTRSISSAQSITS